MDTTETIRRVRRVLRIGDDQESTTLYFDALHLMMLGGSLADVGLTLPMGLVTRLRPEDLSAVFALDGISSVDVPLIQDLAAAEPSA